MKDSNTKNIYVRGNTDKKMNDSNTTDIYV